MTVLQTNLNINPLEDAADDSLVGGGDQLRPFLASASAPLNSVGTFNSSATMVSMVNGVATSKAVSISNVHWIYNTLAADKYFGTPFGVGRNTLTAPTLQRIDLSIYKIFALAEKLKLQIRGEATNAFNHPNYAVPNLYVDSPNFLNPTSTEVSPRIIRLGARIIF